MLRGSPIRKQISSYSVTYKFFPEIPGRRLTVLEKGIKSHVRILVTIRGFLGIDLLERVGVQESLKYLGRSNPKGTEFNPKSRKAG